MERVIFHCDLNCFFASVELLDRPELRQKPVAVGGDGERRHGIILAKNELAKTAGVKTAETIWQAKTKCPSLIVLPSHHEKYERYSRLVSGIYTRYSDRIEPFGIDESWLDMTGTYHLFGADPAEVADRIREEVKRELGLTVSVGVSFNKIFAKLGSDYRKPDATTVITRENFREIVWPLPVSDLMYVGRAAGEVLSRYGIRTIGDLAAASPETPERLLGKQGRMLWNFANGLDDSEVAPLGETGSPKSLSHGETFPEDLISREEVGRRIAALAEHLACRLRAAGMKALTLQITLRDNALRDTCRQCALDEPTCTARDISGAALALVEKCRRADAPVRALTLSAQNLVPAGEAAHQLSFFDAEEMKRRARDERRDRLMDDIRRKHGSSAIKKGVFISDGKNGGEVPF